MARTTGSHADITGPKIEDAALQLFARHGFAAVSMRQIAAEVGVQAGALYNYTSDKQSLLARLMAHHLEQVLAAWDARDPGGHAVDRLEAFTRFHITYHLARGDAVFIAYMELRNLTPENFARVEALRHAYEDRLDGILTAGVAEGAFDVLDTRITTLAIIAMLTGVTTWYRPDGRLSPENVADHYWSMVRKAVTP